jgi:DNA-binding MarR family transcriptional regulator/N-acetylglutamate synthase-like GNAT family acetyltransferase
MAAASAHQLSPERIARVRSFNRFYTRQIGVLNEHLLESSFSLTEVRVLYELAHREHLTAAELCTELSLDAGYVSRMLHNFEKKGLLERSESKRDARQSMLSLTSMGRKTLAPLEARSQEQVAGLLGKIAPAQQKRLLEAMQTIEEQLGTKPRQSSPYLLRSHRPGDMGWVVWRHGLLYFQEYGYDERFEVPVAGIVAEFIEKLDPVRERCWIAEKDGENVGSVFLVKKSKSVAKLRLLLVEPSARGLGLGHRLVAECIRFARQAGYKKILLWTQSELAAARSIYQKAGFKLAGKEKHASWSRTDLVAESWEMKL